MISFLKNDFNIFRDLHEGSLLWNLKTRYHAGQIYVSAYFTYCLLHCIYILFYILFYLLY